MGQGDNVNISEVTCELQPALGTSGAGCSGQREQQGQRHCYGKESAWTGSRKKASEAESGGDEPQVTWCLVGPEQSLDFILSSKLRANCDLCSLLTLFPVLSHTQWFRNAQKSRGVTGGEGTGGPWGFSWRQVQPSTRKVDITGCYQPNLRARLPNDWEIVWERQQREPLVADAWRLAGEDVLCTLGTSQPPVSGLKG